MVVLIGIEGAGGNANKPSTGYVGSFVHKIVTNWPGPKHYNHGPYKFMGGIENVAKKAETFAVNLYTPQVNGIVVLGYSRGGAAAIRLCQLLEARNISVDCLALVDAIDLDPSVGTIIPNNVQLTAHAVRGANSGSRPYWGNCGTSAKNTLHKAAFNVTHWGASGVPAHKGVAAIPQGASLNTLVEEESFITGNYYNTKITWKNDIYAGPGMYAYVVSFLNATYQRLASQKPPAGGGGHVSPGIPNIGNPNKGQVHKVVSGESLSLITEKHWKDLMLFPLIYDANALVVGPNWNLIRPGMLLTIPDKSSYSVAQLSAARQRARSG